MELEFIRKSLSENRNVDSDLIDELQGIFYNILNMMDDRNFTRFIRNSKVSSLARSLIYEVVDESKEQYFKDNPNVLGFHKKFAENGTIKQSITIRKSDDPEIVKRYKGTGTHETIHALAALMNNGYGGFGPFFGEGITEYLSMLVNNETQTDSYVSEVNTSRMAHKMFGDSFIIAYLTGNGANYFENLMKSSLNCKDSDNARKRTAAMKKDFDIAFGEKEDGTLYSVEERKEALKRGQLALVDHYVDYMKLKCENQAYFKGGRLDIDGFFKDVMPVVASLYTDIPAAEIQPVDLFRKIADNFFENSFFKSQIPGKEVDPVRYKEHVMSQLTSHFAREFIKTAERNEDGEIVKILPYREENYVPFDTSKIYQYELYEYNAAALQASVLLDKAKSIRDDFINGSFVNDSTFLKSLAAIIAQSERVDKGLLTKIASQAVSNKIYTMTNSEKVSEFTRAIFPTLASYSLLEREYQESDSLLDYVPIRLEAFGDSDIYAGVRDDKRVLIINDFENASVSEISLEGDEESRASNFQNGIDVRKEDDEKGIFTITKDGKTSQIKIDRDTVLDKVEVLSGGFLWEDENYNVPLSLDYLANRIIFDTAFYSLGKAVDSGEYVFRKDESQGEVTRPKKGILFQKLYDDLDAMRNFSYSLDKRFTDAIIEELFNQLYKIDEEKEDSLAAHVFDMKKDMIKKSFYGSYMANLLDAQPAMAALASKNQEFEELEETIRKLPSRLHQDFFDGLIDLSADEIGFSDVENAKSTIIETEEEKNPDKKKSTDETENMIL